MTLMTHLLLV